MSGNPRPDTAAGDVVGTLVLLIAMGALAWFLWIWVLLSQMAFIGCGSASFRCNSELSSWSVWVYLIGSIGCFVAALVVAIVRRVRGLPSWRTPLAGIGAVIVVFVVSIALVGLGTARW